jgi:hypothetical protein
MRTSQRLAGPEGPLHPLVGLQPGEGIARDRSKSAPRVLPNSGSATTSLALASRAFVVSPCVSSEGDGTRTRNHRIDSPPIPFSNANPHQQLTASDAAGRSAGRSDQQGEGGIADADLARLVAVWPTLPEPIRAAIRALIGTVAVQ